MRFSQLKIGQHFYLEYSRRRWTKIAELGYNVTDSTGTIFQRISPDEVVEKIGHIVKRRAYDESQFSGPSDQQYPLYKGKAGSLVTMQECKPTRELLDQYKRRAISTPKRRRSKVAMLNLFMSLPEKE